MAVSSYVAIGLLEVSFFLGRTCSFACFFFPAGLSLVENTCRLVLGLFRLLVPKSKEKSRALSTRLD